MLAAAVLVLVTLGGALGVFWVARQGSDGASMGPERGEFDALAARVWELEQLVDALPVKWEEFAKQAKRSEDRARAIVRRAREELEEQGLEHAGVEAEARELRLGDGDGSQGGGMQPVRADMAQDPQARPPGLFDDDDGGSWDRATLARKYGMS